MNEQIAGLVRLQQIDKEWEALRRACAGVAPRRAALDERRNAAGALSENAKKALTETQVKRKSLELDVDAKDQLIRKCGGELNGVKSNDAYKAILHQIETAKQEKTALEDQVLSLMEEAESLQRQAKEAEAAAQAERTQVGGLEAALAAEEADLTARCEAKGAEREAFAATLPAATRERYDAVRRGRPDFVAVVPVNGMTCGGCRTGLTPSTVNEVMKGKELVVCEGCSRILFLPPKPPAEPAPAAEPR